MKKLSKKALKKKRDNISKRILRLRIKHIRQLAPLLQKESALYEDESELL